MQNAGARVITPGIAISPIDEIGSRPDRGGKDSAQDIEQVREEPLALGAGKLDHEVKKNNRNENNAGVTQPGQQVGNQRIFDVKENRPTGLPITRQQTPGAKGPTQLRRAVPGEDKNTEAKRQKRGNKRGNRIECHVGT